MCRLWEGFFMKVLRKIALIVTYALVSVVLLNIAVNAYPNVRMQKTMVVGEKFEVGCDQRWHSENPDIVNIECIPCPSTETGSHDYAVAVEPGYAILKCNYSGDYWSINVISEPLPTPVPSPKPVLVGDINGDDIVDSIDAVLIKKYILGLVTQLPVKDSLYSADLNNDKLIDSLDYAIIKRFVLEIINSFPKQHLYPQNMPTPNPIYVDDKLDTIIRPIGDEPLKLDGVYGGQFKVKLTDFNGKPLEGKIVMWENIIGNNEDNHGSSMQNVNSAVTDADGTAYLSFQLYHRDSIYYYRNESSWHIYFNGDDKYNPCTYKMSAITSNGGGVEGYFTTPAPTPVPLCQDPNCPAKLKNLQ